MSELEQNGIVKKGIKSVFYVLGSQIVTLLLGLVTAFFVPKILSVEDYGYWNIYLFYAGYSGLFQLGVVDGIYLKYGDYEYKDLPFKLFRRVFDILLLFLLGMACVLIGLILLFEKDPGKLWMYAIAALNVSIGVFGIFVMVSQITNRFKQYSFMTVMGKLLLVVSILGLYFTNTFGFKVLSVSDFVIKVILLLLMMYFFKDLVFGPRVSWSEGLKETFDNIRVGMSLMIANILGMLLLGLGRFIIERFQTVEEFGKYSFTINTTNLVMMFVASVSLVVYPILRRLNKDKLAESYNSMNSLLMITVFLLLLTYYPLEWLVEHYYTNFKPILNYLYIFYPIIIFQSKLQMLVNSFYKAMREEKALMLSNLLAVGSFGLFGSAFYFLFPRIETIVWCTIIVVVLWCYGAEVYILKKMKMNFSLRRLLLELMVPAVFMLSVGLIGGAKGFIAYLFVLTFYYFINQKTIVKNGKNLFSVVFGKRV